MPAASLEWSVEDVFEPEPAEPVHEELEPAFASLWEFAVGVNRSDPAAIALARHGAHTSMLIDGADVRKLIGTVWFRGVAPKLSDEWRKQLLEALLETLEVRNHTLGHGRRATQLKGLTYAALQDVAKTSVPDVVRTDLDLLLTIGRLWGDEALARVRFADLAPESRFAGARARLLAATDRFPLKRL
jgi:hypothetical protein